MMVTPSTPPPAPALPPPVPLTDEEIRHEFAAVATMIQQLSKRMLVLEEALLERKTQKRAKSDRLPVPLDISSD